MKLKTSEYIDKYAERGVSKSVLKMLLWEVYNSELIRFDSKGNPYWNTNGESLDPDVELEWED
jgi:hypothetical protein